VPKCDCNSNEMIMSVCTVLILHVDPPRKGLAQRDRACPYVCKQRAPPLVSARPLNARSTPTQPQTKAEHLAALDIARMSVPRTLLPKAPRTIITPPPTALEILIQSLGSDAALLDNIPIDSIIMEKHKEKNFGRFFDRKIDMGVIWKGSRCLTL